MTKIATQQDVRRIALALPGAREEDGRFAFFVESRGKRKGFVWCWLERVEPKKARVPSAEVIAVRVRDQAEKSALLAGDPDRFFTEPHYNGFPAVLVRLRAVTPSQLRRLIFDAWECQAPRELKQAPRAEGPAKRSRRGRPAGARGTGRRKG